MSKLVRQDGNDFIRVRLLDKSIVNDNVLLPRQTIEIGVRVGTALRPINDEEVLQREFMRSSQSIDLGLEFALLKRRKLIEQGLNKDGIRRRRKELQPRSKHPQVKDELIARFLDNFQKSSQDGGHQRKRQQIRLDHVRDKQRRRLLIEAEFLFQNKGIVHAGRHR